MIKKVKINQILLMEIKEKVYDIKHNNGKRNKNRYYLRNRNKEKNYFEGENRFDNSDEFRGEKGRNLPENQEKKMVGSII